MPDDNTEAITSQGGNAGPEADGGYGTIRPSSAGDRASSVHTVDNCRLDHSERVHDYQYTTLTVQELVEMFNRGDHPYCAEEEAAEHGRRAKVWGTAGICGTGLIVLGELVGGSTLPGVTLASISAAGALKEFGQSLAASREQGSNLRGKGRRTIRQLLGHGSENETRLAEEGQLLAPTTEGGEGDETVRGSETGDVE